MSCSCLLKSDQFSCSRATYYKLRVWPWQLIFRRICNFKHFIWFYYLVFINWFLIIFYQIFADICLSFIIIYHWIILLSFILNLSVLWQTIMAKIHIIIIYIFYFINCMVIGVVKWFICMRNRFTLFSRMSFSKQIRCFCWNSTWWSKFRLSKLIFN